MLLHDALGRRAKLDDGSSTTMPLWLSKTFVSYLQSSNPYVGGISHRRFEWYCAQDKVAQAAADEALALALSEAHHQEAQAMAYKVICYHL